MMGLMAVHYLMNDDEGISLMRSSQMKPDMEPSCSTIKRLSPLTDAVLLDEARSLFTPVF